MSSEILFSVPDQYSFVIGSSCLAALVLNISGLVLAFTRSSIYNDDVISRYNERVKSEPNPEGSEVPAVPAKGYPDEGNGRISKTLPYKDWIRFNKVNRGFLNYNELIVVHVLSILLCGLYKPVWAGWIGVSIAVGRLLYFIGYAFLV